MKLNRKKLRKIILKEMAENFQTISSYDADDIFYMNYENLQLVLQKSDPREIQLFLMELKRELNELSNEYFSGDPNMYPPDWYDQYAYPIQSSIAKIEDLSSLIKKSK